MEVYLLHKSLKAKVFFLGHFHHVCGHFDEAVGVSSIDVQHFIVVNLNVKAIFSLFGSLWDEASSHQMLVLIYSH